MQLETFDCTVGLLKEEKDLISPVFLMAAQVLNSTLTVDGSSKWTTNNGFFKKRGEKQFFPVLLYATMQHTMFTVWQWKELKEAK